MVERAIDRAYLDEQYGTEERLRIRLEAHQRYSERPDDFFEWVLDRLDPQPGDLVVDVGCGVWPPLAASRDPRASSRRPRLHARGLGHAPVQPRSPGPGARDIPFRGAV